jgi:predicted RNase H-like nuclease (RuvC/YqgF family)
MRRTLLHAAMSLLLLFIVQVSLAQTSNDAAITQLQQGIKDLKAANSNLKTELKNQKTDFSNKLAAADDSIKNLRTELENNKNNIATISNDLGVKISATETSANSKIKTLDDTIGKNTLYWIIAVLAIALLSVLLFGLLRKQVTKNKTDITANIQQTKKALEEEGVKLDSKLADLLATQMLLMKEERQAVPSSKAEEVNHELALKVADEIIRIQKNLGNMDVETKGLKQLVASVKRIQDNFEANGYELVEMLNKPYDQGMKVTANFKPDETLKTGEQIITRIIKPQVNFKGVMIQSAQIEVSQGE